jgi:hypothetical protein
MNIEKLKTYYIYINKENSILQIKENTIPCTSMTETTSMIPKMNIIQQIQTMKKDELGSYILTSMALHHIVVNDNNVSDYVVNKITHHSFFREISYLSDIHLHETNNIFHPLSALYIILQEKPHTPQSQTKKVRFDLGKTKKRKSLKQKY